MADNKSYDMVGPVFEFAQPPEKKSTEYLTADKGWVYSAITLIARETSQVNLRLYKKKRVYNRRKRAYDIEVEEVTEHEALSVLYHCNDFMTMGQLIEITQTYLDLAGEAPWAILRVNGQPSELWPLRPDWLDVKPSKTKYIDHYVYHPGGGFKKVVIPPEDLIMFKYFNPVRAYRGKGAVQASSMAIDIDDFSNEYNRTFFFNAALPSIFFTTDKRIGKNEIERLMHMWRSKFEGRKNAHKVAFLGKGLTPHEIGGKHRELDFIESKKYIRDEILAAFHVSKANLGIVEDVNRANQEASDARFKAKVIKPRLISLCYYLNEFYLRNWPKEDLFFNFDDPVPKDVELNLKVYENGLKYGWLTINEVREKENYPPVEGGNQVYLPFNLQPVGSVMEGIRGLFGKKKDKQSGVITLKAKRKSAQDKIKEKMVMPIPPRRLRELRKEKTKKKIYHDLVKLVVNVMKLSEEQAAKTKSTSKIKKYLADNSTREAYWKAMVAKTDAQEQKMRQVMTGLWEEQRNEIYRRIENAARPKSLKKFAKRDIPQMLYVLSEENRRWFGVMAMLIKDIVVEKGQETFDLLGMPRDLDLTTARAASFLREKGVKFIGSVNETTRERLRNSLAEGVEKNEGIPEMKKRVEQIYASVVKNKGEQVARTEVIRATNFAVNEAYRQSEIVTAKEWLTAYDERVCPFCNEMNGKVVDVSSNYFKQGDKMVVDGQQLEFGYENVAHPPLHPGCRCTLIPVIGKRSAQSIAKEKIKDTIDELSKKFEDKEAELKDIKESLKKERIKNKKKALKEAKKELEKEQKEALKDLKKARAKARELLYNE